MSAASGEPKVVAKLREEAQGRYDLEELSVEEGRELVAYIDTLRARLVACERVVDAAKVWAYYDDVTGPHGLDGTAWVNAVADAADALRAAVATAQEASVDDDFGPNDGHARTVRRSAGQEDKV